MHLMGLARLSYANLKGQLYLMEWSSPPLVERRRLNTRTEWVVTPEGSKRLRFFMEATC